MKWRCPKRKQDAHLPTNEAEMERKIKRKRRRRTHLRRVMPSSTYFVWISLMLLMSCLKVSPSMTKQHTPSGSSAMTLAVLVSSLPIRIIKVESSQGP